MRPGRRRCVVVAVAYRGIATWELPKARVPFCHLIFSGDFEASLFSMRTIALKETPSMRRQTSMSEKIVGVCQIPETRTTRDCESEGHELTLGKPPLNRALYLNIAALLSRTTMNTHLRVGPRVLLC